MDATIASREGILGPPSQLQQERYGSLEELDGSAGDYVAANVGV